MTRRAPGYEHSDAPPKIAWLSLGLIAGGLALSLALVALLLHAFNAADPSPPPHPGPPRQGPPLETQPGQALDEVRARAAQQTGAYGWADPAHSAAHIPIERAMQITAQRGWADAPAGGPP